MSRAQHKGKELCAEIDILHRTFDPRDCQNEPQYRNNVEYFFANHGKKKVFHCSGASVGLLSKPTSRGEPSRAFKNAIKSAASDEVKFSA